MITKSRLNRTQLIALLLPGLLLFAAFTVYPIIRLFWMSLCDMSFSSMLTQPFNGIANYKEVFQDQTFWTVFVNSIVYTLITVPGQMAIGLFTAILLNGIKRFSVTFRVINYLPVVTSWVIASLVFRYIFNTEGLLNYFLWKILGVTSSNVRWLDSRWGGLSVAWRPCSRSHRICMKRQKLMGAGRGRSLSMSHFPESKEPCCLR